MFKLTQSLMKKIIYAVIITAISVQFASAQQGVDFGIKIGPGLSFSNPSIGDDPDFLFSYEEDGSALKLMIGAFLDIPLNENIYLQTGLNLAPKATRYRFVSTYNFSVNVRPLDIDVRVDHQFFQVPLLFKLYTSDVESEFRTYLNVGAVPEFRLKTKDEWYSDRFYNFDLSGQFGFGVEKRMGERNRIFVSLNYYNGFLDQIRRNGDGEDYMQLTHRLLNLEFGIKF